MSEEQVPAPAAPSEFRLVPLDCPTCGSAVQAASIDVVFYCVSCRNGYRFDDDRNTLEPVDVAFVAASHIAAHDYRPFWLLPAEVEIRRRGRGRTASYTGILRSLLGGSGGGRPVGRGGKGTFAVPAFQAPLEATTRLVRRYTEALPELGEKLGERLLGGCYGVEDAQKLAHFALIASEIEQPDVLRSLDYRIRFGSARLLGVPFSQHGESWEDAIFGIEV